MRRRSRPLIAGGAALGLALLAASGCGHDHPPFAGDPQSGGSSGTSSGGNQFQFDASTAPPTCQLASPDGGVCGCTDLPLVTDVPTLYFVLDRSGSMSLQNKWTVVRTVVAKVMTSIGPRADFGAAVFPAPGSDNCSAGAEVMLPRRGDSPAGYAGNTAAAFSASTNYGANGGTPTAATLSLLAPHLAAIGGRTYVLLATDGGPNCDDNTTCDVTGCIVNIESSVAGCVPNTAPNCCDSAYFGPSSCLDTAATVSAVAALHHAGIDTYVIGVPGSAPYASVLDQLATAGGTARASEPLYYRVDDAGESALLAALSQIAAKIVATCTLSLGAPPADPNQVNVYIDDGAVPKDPVDGWALDGSTVTLLGKTCDRVMSGSALDVRVVVGCPTVGPR